MKILLVEDDQAIAVPLGRFLESNGYAVQKVAKIKEAKEKLRSEHFEIVLLDRALPDGDGLSLMLDIKQKEQLQSAAPAVIVLSAKVEVSDRIFGLELGADDYVTKPFEREELIARIRARTRNFKGQGNSFERTSSQDETRCGSIVLNKRSHRVTFENKELQLTIKEFELLEYFLQNEGAALAREVLLLKVWGMRYQSTRTLDVHVSSLRQKIGPEFFETVHGLGYRFRKAQAAPHVNNDDGARQ